MGKLIKIGFDQIIENFEQEIGRNPNNILEPLLDGSQIVSFSTIKDENDKKFLLSCGASLSGIPEEYIQKIINKEPFCIKITETRILDFQPE